MNSYARSRNIVHLIHLVYIGLVSLAEISSAVFDFFANTPSFSLAEKIGAAIIFLANNFFAFSTTPATLQTHMVYFKAKIATSNTP